MLERGKVLRIPGKVLCILGKVFCNLGKYLRNLGKVLCNLGKVLCNLSTAAPFEVDAVCDDGLTPLHLACICGHLGTATALIKHGADKALETTFAFDSMFVQQGGKGGDWGGGVAMILIYFMSLLKMEKGWGGGCYDIVLCFMSLLNNVGSLAARYLLEVGRIRVTYEECA